MKIVAGNNVFYHCKQLFLGAKGLALLFLLNFVFHAVNAQTNQQIKVRLFDRNDQTAIPFSKVSILDDKNKILISIPSDQFGQCVFKLNDTLSGKVRLQTKPLGFEEYRSDLISFTKDTLQLISIGLQKSALQLAEVQIFQKKIVNDGEKLIYNLKHDQFSTGTSTAEIFSKLPGVSLGAGALKLNGRTGVLILIDGKGELKSQAQQLAILANLSSDQVERVEISSSASARYDANISSVINVITKKTKGYSNLRLGYSQPLYMDGKNFGSSYPSGNGGTNLNFLINKVRASFSVNTSNSTGLENSEEQREIKNLLRYEGLSLSNNYSFNIFSTLNLDYDINKRSSVSLNTDLTISPSYLKKTNSSYLFFDDQTNLLDSTINIANKLAYDYKRISLTGSYKYKLDTVKNSFLYLTGIYAANPYTQKENLFKSKNGAMALPTVANHINGRFDIYSASAILTNLVKTSFLSTEIGAKLNILDNATQQELNGGTYTFDYHENLSALYASLRWKLGQYVLMTELRTELLNSTVSFWNGNEQKVTNNYFRAYPNLLLQRTIGKDLNLSLGYTKKVRRPLAAYLNPSQTFARYYNSAVGNLNYLPGFYDRIEAQARYKTIGLTLYYEHSINQRTLLPTSDPFVFEGSNLGKLNNYGLSLNKSFEIGKWFSSNNNVDFSYTQKGNDNIMYSRDSWPSFGLNSANDFTLSKRTRLQLELYYNGNSYSPFGVFGNFFSSAVNLKQLFFKDRLTLNVNVSDPLGVKKLWTKDLYPLQSGRTEQLTSDRTFSLQLIYKFRFGRNFTKQSYKNKNDGEIRY